MEEQISLQAAQLVQSLALGVLLGFLYELLRLPRHLIPALGLPLDTVFCLTVAAGLFLLAMASGGTLRYYMPFAAALGAGAYSALFGRWLRPILGRAELFLGRRLDGLKNMFKNLNKNLKNIFSRVKKRFRMFGYTRNDKVGSGVSKSGARRARRKGERDEISKDGHPGKAYYPGGTALRSFHDG